VMVLFSLASILRIQSGEIASFRDIVSENYLTVSDLYALFALAYLSRRTISAHGFLFAVAGSLTVLVFLGSRAALLLFSLCTLVVAMRLLDVKQWIVLIGVVVGGLVWGLGDLLDWLG